MSRVIHLCIILLLMNDTFAEIKNKGWWKNLVFYEVNTRSFADSNNDGIGDINGITTHLSHFVEAGIGGIWLTPIFASPMIDSGYDISDFKDVHPDYGSIHDLKILIQEAKKFGIRVILDLVPNHTSDKHEWFRKSVLGEGKYRNYYVWRTGMQNNSIPPNNWLNMYNGSAWTKVQNHWYLHQFGFKQPDLNYNNPEVYEEMEEIIRYWLRKGVDGFRVHAASQLFEHSEYPSEPRSNELRVNPLQYKYLRHIYSKNDPRTFALILNWRNAMDSYADNNNEDEKLLMIHAYSSRDNIMPFYDFGGHVIFNLKWITNLNHTCNAYNFKNAIDDWIFDLPQNATPSWVLGDHESSRLESRFPGKSDQLMMLQMVLPGIAITYYGEEIGMVDNNNITCTELRLNKVDYQACMYNKSLKYYNRQWDGSRTPYQWDSTRNAGFSDAENIWLPVHENYKETNLLNEQKFKTYSYYNIYAALIKLRRDNAVLQLGSIQTYSINKGMIFAVIRRYADKYMVFLMNFDSNLQIVDLSPYLNFPIIMAIQVSSLTSALRETTRVILSEINMSPNSALVIAGWDAK